jgi:hypothetical protein
MATSNTALQVADLDFFGIRNNLKEFLRSQSTFTDYDFEGSGMAVLLDVLAYNTYYNSYYLNMAANESFLDTAQVRNNILSHAKNINYVPDSAHGSLSKVNIIVTPSTAEDQVTNVITLDKYTRILGQDKNGVNFTFVTLNSNTAYKSAGSFTFSNVFIKQGEVITQQFAVTANNTSRRFQIPSANVDTDTLVVTVQESAANTTTTSYTLAEDLTTITANSKVYFLEEDDQLNYTIYFGDDVLGYKPKNGNIVIATYLDTVGSISNNISKFTFIDPIGGPEYRDSVIVNTVETSYGGSDKETVENIRFRAPYYYTAQNRAVTVPDYESLITKDYNNIDSVSIWGGEDNDPVVYGKVYMSLKTRGYYVLSNLEKERIKNDLVEKRNVLTILPEIVDPDYVFLMVQGRVTYNPSLTSLTAGEIRTVVNNAIKKYNDDELAKFKSTFKKSKLQYYIENAERSITGSDIVVYLQKRLPLTLNQTKNYTINFNAALKKGDFIEKVYSFPSYTVVDSASVFRNVFIEEVPNSFTGIDLIKITNAGSGYYSVPTVTITGDGTGATAVADITGDGRVKSITVTNSGINYSRATISITGEGSEATGIPVLQARNGILRTFYYKTNGEKVVVNENAGTINYDTGKIQLSSLIPLAVSSNDFYDTNVVSINVVPNGDIIYPLRNRILAIDENNFQSIQIEVVAES